MDADISRAAAASMCRAAVSEAPCTAAAAAAAGSAADAAAAAAAEASGSRLEYLSKSPPESPFESPDWGVAVAEAAQAAFAALPPTGKPQPHEHTVMAAFLVSVGGPLQGMAGGALQGLTSGEPAPARPIADDIVSPSAPSSLHSLLLVAESVGQCFQLLVMVAL